MLLCSLLKTQHFVIPLSVTVSKAKNFSSPFFRNDDQTWEVKGEKRTSENRRKINGLKASKNWDVNGNFLSEFFLSSYRNFQTIPSVPPRMAFFYRKNSTVTRRSLPPCLKKSKGPMNVLNSGLLVRLRFKNMRVLNKCLTLR